jgi:hypothetical protein
MTIIAAMMTSVALNARAMILYPQFKPFAVTMAARMNSPTGHLMAAEMEVGREKETPTSILDITAIEAQAHFQLLNNAYSYLRSTNLP